MEVLQEFDVEAAAAVRGTAALKEADWKELLRQEGLDTGMKRRAYIKFAAYRLLVQDVQWQFASFAQASSSTLGKDVPSKHICRPRLDSRAESEPSAIFCYTVTASAFGIPIDSEW